MTVSASEPSISPALGKVIKFRELKPLWPNAAESTEFVMPFYKYCDGAQPRMAPGVPAGAEAQELRMIIGVSHPGQGMPLHNHSGEELMFAAGGTWLIYFDAAEQIRAYLEPWDAILIPGGVARGWRNVGRDMGCLLNISSLTDKMTLVPTPYTAE